MSGAPGPPGGWTPFGKGKARQDAFDPEASGSSSRQHWSYCRHCGRIPDNVMACFEQNHDLPNLWRGSAMLGPTATDIENDLTHSTTFSSDMSSQHDNNALFSTNGTTGSSIMDGSHFRPQYDFALDRQGSQILDDAYPSSTYGTQEVLSQAAQETLNFWRVRCEAQRRDPSDREIQSIASLENLRIDAVRSWFATNLSISPIETIDPPRAANTTQAHSPHASETERALAEVRNYALDRNSRACENAQSKKASKCDQKLLHCCLGCSYSTNDKDSWHRHHKNKFPQEFWHCVLCRNTDGRFMCHRKDKLIPHLNSMHSHHPAVQQGRHDEIRDESYVPYSADYPRACPFHNGTTGCDQTFSSWAEFVQHCLDHLLSRISQSADGPWTLRYQRQRPFDDDDEDSQGPSRSTSSYSAVAGFRHTTSMGENDASTTQGGRSQHIAGQRSYKSTGNAVPASSSAEPRYLIDVQRGKRVEAPSMAKYLALEYTWATRDCPQARWRQSGDAIARPGQDLWADNVPLPFRKAMTLTRDMGYRYLWIDVLCDDTPEEHACIAVYERAVFILVIVTMDSSHDHIWHFTCDYRNLHIVLSWFENSTSGLPFLHVQNLGHGAYGIVDEVQLRTTHESFARKVCMKKKDDEQSPDLQEMEILQKFNHPNIPQFIAAYYQKQSLNILMLPVAECNLKEYLSEPAAYDKRHYMQQWYYSLADAVDYMHGLSCRHKDIKPANILISGPKVLLSDFGTSLDFSLDNSTSTGPGYMTPKYCAPEVARGQPRGRKADIFSLGCVFVEMVTVDVGLPLSSLSRYLGFHAQPRSTCSVYHLHIERLKKWLTLLRSKVSMAHQGLVLHIADKMIDALPQQRPSAAAVMGGLWTVLPPVYSGIAQNHMAQPSFLMVYTESCTRLQGVQSTRYHERNTRLLEPIIQVVVAWSVCVGDKAVQCIGVMTTWLYHIEWHIRAWETWTAHDVVSVMLPNDSTLRLQDSSIATLWTEAAISRNSRIARGLHSLRRLARVWLFAARGCSSGMQATLPIHQGTSKKFMAIDSSESGHPGAKLRDICTGRELSPIKGLHVPYARGSHMGHREDLFGRTRPVANVIPSADDILCDSFSSLPMNLHVEIRGLSFGGLLSSQMLSCIDLKISNAQQTILNPRTQCCAEDPVAASPRTYHFGADELATLLVAYRVEFTTGRSHDS